MAKQLVRAAWILVALVAIPGWVLSFYVLPLNLVAVVILFAMGFVVSKSRALDAFMLTVFAGMVLVAVSFILVLDAPEGRRGTIAIASIIFASALLVMKCGALYSHQTRREPRAAMALSTDVSVMDRHTARRPTSALDDGSRWMTLLFGAFGMLAAFVSVVLLLLMLARNLSG